MTARTRDFLKPEFKDGERPSGADFSDLIDSFISISSDGVSLDTDGNLVLARGLSLNNSNATVAGSLRFASSQVQFFDGTTWKSLTSGNPGAFQALGNAHNDVAYAGGGFVGVGAAYTLAAPPQSRFEVSLGDGGTAGELVRFGNLVCCNGTGVLNTNAMVAHQAHASSTNFALRQSQAGSVDINAAQSQPIGIRQGGLSIRLGITAAGNVIVGGGSELVGAPATDILQVNGGAGKTVGGGSWDIISDARVKDNVRDLDAGLAQLCQLRPVRFRYNGRAGTAAGVEDVGVLAQEIETVLPETVQKASGGAPAEQGLEDLRIFNPSALTFVLINAVKELATRVEQLELALAETSTKGPTRGGSRKPSTTS